MWTDDVSRSQSSNWRARTANTLARARGRIGSYALSSAARILPTTAAVVSNAGRMATKTALQALDQVSLAQDCVLVWTEHHTQTRSRSANTEMRSRPAGNVWTPAESAHLPLGFRMAAKISARRATCRVRPVSRLGGRSLETKNISSSLSTPRPLVLSKARKWTWTMISSPYQAARREHPSPSQVVAILVPLQSHQLIHQATPAAPSRQCAPSSAIPCSLTIKTQLQTSLILATFALPPSLVSLVWKSGPQKSSSGTTEEAGKRSVVATEATASKVRRCARIAP